MSFQTLSENESVKLIVAVKQSNVLHKLNSLAKKTTGLYLLILVRSGAETVELYPAGGNNELPAFCQVFRSSKNGLDGCHVCRSLVALGACYRGLSVFSCHGGVSVVAAPGMSGHGKPSQHVVVVSCAFAQSSAADGWTKARRQAINFDIDMSALKRAYFELPVVEDSQIEIAKSITETAASVLGEIEDHARGMTDPRFNRPGTNKPKQGGATTDFREVLLSVRNGEFIELGQSTGSTLIDLVIAMIRQDPSMPYNIDNISGAARISPNYFSTLFKKHTGKTFQKFLTEERITFACELLCNPCLNISEVALQAGFSDSAYFSRRFKQVMGTAPKTWRNTKQEA